MNTTSVSCPMPGRDSLRRRVWAALRKALAARHRQRDVFSEAVQEALALTPRGGVAYDVLRMQSVSASMQVQWTARPIHPWDKDLPIEHQDEAFASQCLRDVDEAIARLFARLASIEHLEIAVIHPQSRTNIVAGLVSRADFVAAKRLSVPMRLKMAGVAYEIGRGGLQPVRE